MTIDFNKVQIAEIEHKSADSSSSDKVNNTHLYFGCKMNSINGIIFCSLALICLISTIEGAAVVKRSPDMPESNVSPTTSAPEPSTPAEKICHGSTPCGWAVYSPINRRVEYFMKNICVCPSTKNCINVDDDLAISAYVYKCEDKPQEPETTPSSE